MSVTSIRELGMRLHCMPWYSSEFTRVLPVDAVTVKRALRTSAMQGEGTMNEESTQLWLQNGLGSRGWITSSTLSA